MRPMIEITVHICDALVASVEHLLGETGNIVPHLDMNFCLILWTFISTFLIVDDRLIDFDGLAFDDATSPEAGSVLHDLLLHLLGGELLGMGLGRHCCNRSHIREVSFFHLRMQAVISSPYWLLFL